MNKLALEFHSFSSNLEKHQAFFARGIIKCVGNYMLLNIMDFFHKSVKPNSEFNPDVL